MSDYVYTKSALISRQSKGMTADMPAASMQDIADHLEAMHPRTDAGTFTRLFLKVVVVENDYWPRDVDLEAEIRDFLLAVRKGDTPLLGASAGFYAEMYREWKRTKRTEMAQESRSTFQTYHVPESGALAITAQNYAAEFEECWTASTHPGDTVATWTQRKQCLRDLLEGIENHLNDHKQAGTKSEFDEQLRSRYKQARTLWQRMTGREWEILQPRTTNLQTGRQWGRRKIELV